MTSSTPGNDSRTPSRFLVAANVFLHSAAFLTRQVKSLTILGQIYEFGQIKMRPTEYTKIPEPSQRVEQVVPRSLPRFSRGSWTKVKRLVRKDCGHLNARRCPETISMSKSFQGVELRPALFQGVK